MKAKAIRLWPEASHLFKSEVLSISVGLWMYTRASPFSLAVEKLPRQFTWNELTSLKCFSPKFFRLIWAGLILNNPTFFYELFSQLTFLQKKSEHQDDLPHASYGPECTPLLASDLELQTLAGKMVQHLALGTSLSISVTFILICDTLY